MTEFMKPSFSVYMPGETAKQWPKCEAQHPEFSVTCQLEFGHKGKHLHGDPYCMGPTGILPLYWHGE